MATHVFLTDHADCSVFQTSASSEKKKEKKKKKGWKEITIKPCRAQNLLGTRQRIKEPFYWRKRYNETSDPFIDWSYTYCIAPIIGNSLLIHSFTDRVTVSQKHIVSGLRGTH